MAVSDHKTDQSPEKFSWKRFLSGLFGSNIRETIADIRAIHIRAIHIRAIRGKRQTAIASSNQSAYKPDWRHIFSGLFGSNIRETIADLQIIRDSLHHRQPEHPPEAK